MQLQGHVRLVGSGLKDTQGLTQGKSRSIYNEYLLMVFHMLSPVLDTCGEFKRCSKRLYKTDNIYMNKLLENNKSQL